MKLFLDTEFADFINCQLISIGAITEDGREFYAEVTDYDRTAESQFVKNHVVPLLGQNLPNSFRGSYGDVSCRFGSWIEELKDPVEICVDYKTDWDLVVELLDDLWPKNLANHWVNIYGDMQQACVVHCTQRDAKVVVDGKVLGLDVTPLGVALGEYHKLFNDVFLEHFFIRGQYDPLYQQHHALYDARANREGWMAALRYIKGL